METKNSEKFVKASLKRAEKALKSAKILFENNELEDAVSRAYYAMFHATKALLFSKNLTPKTHRGTIMLFSELVKEGVIEIEFADMLRKAFDMRQKGDYEVYAVFGRDEVRDLIKSAEAFVEEVKRLLGV
ncbi:HEPN domain-containing protein [Archaeoglobales archaeon]|mgnify:CR=1 FL=1|nr:MAG: HEPN domain-containing protein [Archaeoglobales archaeon]